MSKIKVSDLTFSYDEAYDLIFDQTSFEIDTEWKLGFIGRNGKGKTTFLKLLMGEYEYRGTIEAVVDFEYFPYEVKDMDSLTLNVVKEAIAPFHVWEAEMKNCVEENTEESIKRYGEVLELYMQNDGYVIEDRIKMELGKLNVGEDVLERPFSTLSNGERTKVLLAALFLKKNELLLIDEPTNHLDMEGRELLADYLNTKRSFLLVSHDRAFLDRCIDHVLSINKNTIDVIKGNYTTWQRNKDLEDEWERAQNEKLKKEIKRLQTAKEKTANWSNQVESSKIGNHTYDRGRVGHLSAKMMKRSKSIEKRQNDAIEKKEQLLKNVETVRDLKINQLEPEKKRIVTVEDLEIRYGDKTVCKDIRFSVQVGERIALVGKNGCGKTSVIKAILGESIEYKGDIWRMRGLQVSYVSQTTSHLRGNLKDFTMKNGLDYTLFLSVLRQLDFPRKQFEKEMQCFSEGQRKKVLIAGSLVTPSHLFVWDEPLNYVDVLSRRQIEELILTHQPTMLFIEHDKVFLNTIATKVVTI